MRRKGRPVNSSVEACAEEITAPNCHVDARLRLCFGAENGEPNACSEEQNRKREWHFSGFLMRKVGLHAADFGDFFRGVISEARMNETDNSGEHHENAEHQNEALHGLKPYHS